MKTRFLIFLGLGISVLLLFQNCGEFRAGSKDISSNASSSQIAIAQGAQSVVVLTSDPSQIFAGAGFNVRADLSSFPSDAQYLWTHEFSDGLTFCEVTTTFDRTQTTVACPHKGSVLVTLNVIFSDGTSQAYSVTVEILDPSQATQPPPGPIPGPPLPPAPLPGVAIYNSKCASCHGALPDQSNRYNITLAQLDGALVNVPAMVPLASQLSASDKQAIVDALKK